MMPEKKQSIKKEDYEEIYDCIVTDQVPPDKIAVSFDENFISITSKKSVPYRDPKIQGEESLLEMIIQVLSQLEYLLSINQVEFYMEIMNQSSQRRNGQNYFYMLKK